MFRIGSFVQSSCSSSPVCRLRGFWRGRLNSRREELNQRQPPMRCVATLRSNKLSLRQQKLWPRRPRPRQDRLHNLSPLAAVLTRSAYHLPVSRVVFGGRPSTRPFPILAFELTPEGIKRAEDVDLSKSVRRKTGRKLDFFIIAVLLLVISILLFQRFRPNVSPAASHAIRELPPSHLLSALGLRSLEVKRSILG
jgi:hypothetical protein